MRLVLAMAALLAATPASATDWRLLTTATSGDGEAGYYLIDRDSIVRDGGRAEATIYLVAETVTMNLKIEFDCPGKRLRPLGGTLVMDGRTRALGLESWDDQLPASHPEMFNYVCNFDRSAPDSRRSFGADDPVAAVRAMLKKGD